MNIKDKIKDNLHLFIPAVLLLAAVISSAAIYFIRTEQYKDWRPVSGYVISVREGRRFRIIIDYTYTIKGVDYERRESFHNDRKTGLPAPGTSVTIWYDPDKPYMSSYFEPYPALDPLGPFFIALPLCAATYLLYSRRTKLLPGSKH